MRRPHSDCDMCKNKIGIYHCSVHNRSMTQHQRKLCNSDDRYWDLFHETINCDKSLIFEDRVSTALSEKNNLSPSSIDVATNRMIKCLSCNKFNRITGCNKIHGCSNGARLVWRITRSNGKCPENKWTQTTLDHTITNNDYDNGWDFSGWRS